VYVCVRERERERERERWMPPAEQQRLIHHGRLFLLALVSKLNWREERGVGGGGNARRVYTPTVSWTNRAINLFADLYFQLWKRKEVEARNLILRKINWRGEEKWLHLSKSRDGILGCRYGEPWLFHGHFILFSATPS
jgi:hypothetical protein